MDVLKGTPAFIVHSATNEPVRELDRAHVWVWDLDAVRQMALLLAVARKLPQAHAHLRGGRWERERFVGVEMYGKTLGIVGLGRVGTEVARRAQGFAMTVVAYDPYLGTEIPERPGVELVDLDTLLRRSDFITVHIPLTKETRGLIGAAELERTMSGVRIVNCARGGVLDEAARPLCPAFTPSVVTPDGALITTEDLPNRVRGAEGCTASRVWCMRGERRRTV